MVSYLKDLINEGKFAVTVEAVPPRGADVEPFAEELKLYKKAKADLVGVAENPYGSLCMSSLGGCIVAKRNHAEPILYLTCRDMNLLGIQSELLSAAALGIETIFITSGEHPSLGEFPRATPVYDLDPTRLIRIVKKLNKGEDASGRKVDGYIDLFPGAAINPMVNPRGPEIVKTKRKLMAGCEFFQTKPTFDPKELDAFFREYESMFGESIRHMVLVSVIPPHSVSMLRAMRRMGVDVPKELEEALEGREDLDSVSVRFAVALANEIKKLGFRGVNVIPAGRPDIAARVAKSVKEELSDGLPADLPHV